MPEHSARIQPPGSFRRSSFRRKEIAPGIVLVLGKRPGSRVTETQAIRFDAERWSPAEARKWLREHGYAPIAFEVARGSTMNPNRRKRRFNPLFGDRITALLWDISLESGHDDETGDVDEFGVWYALFRFRPDEDLSEFETWRELDAQEKAEIRRAVGAILWQTDSGAVDSKLFFSRKRLEQAWNECLEETTAEAESNLRQNVSDADESDTMRVVAYDRGSGFPSEGEEVILVEEDGAELSLWRVLPSRPGTGEGRIETGRPGEPARTVIRVRPSRDWYQLSQRTRNRLWESLHHVYPLPESNFQRNPSPQLVQLGIARELELDDGRIYRWKVRDAWPVLVPAGAENRPAGQGKLYLVPPVRSTAIATPSPRSERTFRTWHAFDPRETYSVEVPTSAELDGAIGRATRIVYRSDKWSGEPVDYEHEFARGNGPRVKVSGTPDRPRALVLSGGAFRVSSRGLVD